MAAKDLVNLDAMIPREDLESKRPGPKPSGGIPISQLAVGQHYYGLLRKPLFQRETDDWSVDNVVSLIKSYREGHLIPSVILWTAQGYTFVIDGAHRLSAFIAWVNDDYGDRHISQGFFKNEISKRQKEIADECRKKIAAEGCTYSSLNSLTLLPQRTQEQLQWSTNLAIGIETQYVNGDANSAADSFLAINQRAVQIDRTEKYMIENRTAPNVIAARAIANSARGHAYWGAFSPENVEVIERKARLIYTAIFEPEDANPGADTDLQPAGLARSASGLRMALDLVNITNSINQNKLTEADPDGTATARVIKRTYAVVKYVAGQNPSSLSLHPAVYFWGTTGNHRPSIFLAVIAFLQEMIQKNELIQFTLHRAQLEEFLVGSGALGQNVLSKYGGWKKSVAPIKRMLRLTLDGLKNGKTIQEIELLILAAQKSSNGEDYELASDMSKSKWRKTKTALRHKASIESAIRCPLCKARLVMKDVSDDHRTRRIDGGSSDIDNGDLTHKFCNHGFKEHFAQLGMPIPEILSPVAT